MKQTIAEGSETEVEQSEVSRKSKPKTRLKLLRNYDFRLVSKFRHARRATVGGGARNARSMFVRAFRDTFGHMRGRKSRPVKPRHWRTRRTQLGSDSDQLNVGPSWPDRTVSMKPPELIVTMSREGSEQSDLEEEYNRDSERTICEVMTDDRGTGRDFLSSTGDEKEEEQKAVLLHGFSDSAAKPSTGSLRHDNNDSLFDCDFISVTRQTDADSSTSIPVSPVPQQPSVETNILSREYGSVASIGACCELNLTPTGTRRRSQHRKSISTEL
ncbi:unnamed protein product [Echinostoma caproni]|uniref:K0146 n=1 Tax=Echinostoma caproni TaxID=27848 RepID=A0A183AWN8_9TREM|nr:unnamed protein product [Echinostoma caproni]